jgi:hypothetical protein
MDIPSTTYLTSAEVAQLDPYVFLAVLGKRVIHPGGVARPRSYSDGLTFGRTSRSWTWVVASVRPRLQPLAGSVRR